MCCQREPGPGVESALLASWVTLASPYLSHLSVYQEDKGAGARGTQSYLFSPGVLQFWVLPLGKVAPSSRGTRDAAAPIKPAARRGADLHGSGHFSPRTRTQWALKKKQNTA